MTEYLTLGEVIGCLSGKLAVLRACWQTRWLTIGKADKEAAWLTAWLSREEVGWMAEWDMSLLAKVLSD